MESDFWFLLLLIKCGLQVQYGKDCNKIYGRILDASFVESSTREADRKETEMIWKYFYPEEPYELDLSHSVSAKSAGIIFRSMLKIQYDLTEAVWRQSSFFYQVFKFCSVSSYLSVILCISCALSLL